MPLPVITAENLGKSYLIGHKSAEKQGYHSLRDSMAQNVRSFGRKALAMARGQQVIQGDEIEEFWALRDVSFEIQQGEVVGIIGRNGAGKSTLLKILSRITEPTEGQVTLRGRVASLLEVGTGFHPELSGRENIFLNGAILGMSRNEIRRKFDAIVEFAEVDQFLDTPVKRYSSGMYVRLAFAVAAHLDPEILVIDEVLAVGDAEFQRKCLGKMQDVATEGRTVLFVSHNYPMVRSLCNYAYLLENGRLAASGGVDAMISIIATSSASNQTEYNCSGVGKTGPYVRAVDLSTSTSGVEHDMKKELTFDFFIEDNNEKDLLVGLHIYDVNLQEVVHTSSEFSAVKGIDISPITRFRAVIKGDLLNAGSYSVKVTLCRRNVAIYDEISGSLGFEIIDHNPAAALTSSTDWKGVIAPRAVSWSVSNGVC